MAVIQGTYGRKTAEKKTVPGGGSEIIKAPPIPCTVTVIPGLNTGLVQYSTSLESEIDDATAVWQDWSKGSVTANTSSILCGCVSALKFIAIGGDVVFETVV